MKDMKTLYKSLTVAIVLGTVALTAGCASSTAGTKSDKVSMARFEERAAQNCSWQGPPKLSIWACRSK